MTTKNKFITIQYITTSIDCFLHLASSKSVTEGSIGYFKLICSPLYEYTILNNNTTTDENYWLSLVLDKNSNIYNTFLAPRKSN